MFDFKSLTPAAVVHPSYTRGGIDDPPIEKVRIMNFLGITFSNAWGNNSLILPSLIRRTRRKSRRIADSASAAPLLLWFVKPTRITHLEVIKN